jgi:hypothetical protein
MDRPDSRRVLDSLIVLKQMDPKRIFLGLALDEGNADYIASTKQKKREEKRREARERDKTIYLVIFSLILFPTPCPFLSGLFIICPLNS